MPANLIQRFLGLLIRAYQVTISPLLGNHCRFYPSCSHYAATAISRFGSIKGSWLALKRLSHCHPWHEGGVDPVPENECKHNQLRQNRSH